MKSNFGNTKKRKNPKHSIILRFFQKSGSFHRVLNVQWLELLMKSKSFFGQIYSWWIQTKNCQTKHLKNKTAFNHHLKKSSPEFKLENVFPAIPSGTNEATDEACSIVNGVANGESSDVNRFMLGLAHPATIPNPIGSMFTVWMCVDFLRAKCKWVT